jgi:hypothetical protein
MQVKEQLSPTAFARAVNVDSTFAYMGSLVTFLAKGSETSGRFALVQYHTKPGNEPPPHVHEREHELYFVLDSSKLPVVGVETARKVLDPTLPSTG